VVDQVSWPPKSPREALLASPNGRKRFIELRREREVNDQLSPLKRSRTTPNFLARIHAQESNGGDGIDGEDDEDEETLRLQLAAIEAKLKLKKLQQEKQARLNLASPNAEDEIRQGSFTSSSSSAQPTSRMRAARDRQTAPEQANDIIQVPLSPSKRQVVQEQASPRRALINFKKATEVSLKRPSSSRPATEQPRASVTRPGTSSRIYDKQPSPQDIWSAAAGDFKKPKSFSERIAESRTADKEKQQRVDKIQRNRNSAFNIDKSEVERYKEEAASQPKPTFSAPQRPSEIFSRDEVLKSYGNPQPRIKKSTTAPNTLGSASQRPNSTPAESKGEKASKESDSSKLESFSSLTLSNRILPHSFLSRTLENKSVLRIPQLLKSVKAPDFELPETIDGDYVVFGIVASKSDPKKRKEPRNSTKEVNMDDDGSNNSEQYMVITLTDLNWTIDLFLFDTAFPRYYRLSEGTLIAILNPTILPPPPGKIDTNRFSLCISSSDDTVLEIGSAQDIGYCKAERKDGKTCRSWVDSRKSEFCDFHVDVQIRRTQALRSGINAGTGLFAPGGRDAPRIANFGPPGGKRGGQRGLKSEGSKYDWSTQTTYFVAPARKPASSHGGTSMFPRGGMGGMGGRGSSAAALIDGIEDNPFADYSRGDNKEERTRRRLVEDQRERDIARKLGSKGGSTGAEYLRVRLEHAGPSSATKPTSKSSILSTPGTPSQTAKTTSFISRKADTVSLSPVKKRARGVEDDKPSKNGVNSSVKKTRFITAKGIREAGRDSLGASTGHEISKERSYMVMNNDDDDDDDDELDII
jgi:minichromosome maintenance protein 10